MPMKIAGSLSIGAAGGGGGGGAATDLPVTAGLLAHYDADFYSSLRADGETIVNNWDDYSGNENHLPSPQNLTFDTAHPNLNNLPGVVFPGDETGRFGAVGVPSFTTYTFFFVLRPDNGGSALTISKESGFDASADTNNINQLRFTFNWGANGMDRQVAASVNTERGVLVCSIGPTHGAIMRWNGVEFASHVDTAGNSVTGLRLGRNSSFNNFEGPMGEAAFYNTELSLADIQSVESHLTTKYAL